MTVAVRAASLPGSRMGFMAGLGGNGPIGRSGSSGLSVRWKSVTLWVTRVGRLVSDEVDIVRGFINVGGGSGLSSMAPSELAFLSSSSLL